MSRKEILIVEDDHDIVELVCEQVEQLGYSAATASTGEIGLEMALRGDYALVILDLKLPRLGGLEVCRRLRDENNTIPILILTSESEDADIVLGLELGADEYLTKPFNVKELRARINAVLRRMEAYRKEFSDSNKSVLKFDQLRIDMIDQRVSIGGELIDLTKTEFHLLRCLASRPGHVFSREELLHNVLGYEAIGYEPSVNPHISRLRAKIEKDPSKPRYVLTVRGLGYRFVRADELGDASAAPEE